MLWSRSASFHQATTRSRWPHRRNPRRFSPGLRCGWEVNTPSFGDALDQGPAPRGRKWASSCSRQLGVLAPTSWRPRRSRRGFAPMSPEPGRDAIGWMMWARQWALTWPSVELVGKIEAEASRLRQLVGMGGRSPGRRFFDAGLPARRGAPRRVGDGTGVWRRTSGLTNSTQGWLMASRQALDSAWGLALVDG